MTRGSTLATVTTGTTETETLASVESATQHAAGLFKALADPLRLQLVALTRDAPAGEVCFCDLSDAFGIPQSSLSHHLRVLVTAGVLDRQRRGTWSWYRLQPPALAVLQDALAPDGTLSRMIRGDRNLTDPGTPATRCQEPDPGTGS